MGGVLHFGKELPKLGIPVLISVDDANHPSGDWLGVLSEVTPPKKDQDWTPCKAVIQDPKVSDPAYTGCEPTVNYSVFVTTPGTELLLERLKQSQQDLASLRQRLQIERDTWHMALQALVQPATAEKLEQLLNTLLHRGG